MHERGYQAQELEEPSLEEASFKLKLDEAKKNVRELDAYAERLIWVPAQKRNFDVVAHKEDEYHDGASVVIESRNGEKFDLKNLLPDVYRFVEGTQFTCDREKKEITIAFQYIGTRGDLFAILHEVGHAVNEADIVELARITAEKINHQEQVRPQIEDDDVIHMLDQLLDILKQQQKIETEKQNIRIIDERKASAYSLEMLRFLQKFGYEVFADFNSVREIAEVHNTFLATYEVSRRLGDSLSKTKQGFLSENEMEQLPQRSFLREKKFNDLQKRVNDTITQDKATEQ